MAELPGAEPDEPQDDPDYKPPEPEDEIPPEYLHLKAKALEKVGSGYGYGYVPALGSLASAATSTGLVQALRRELSPENDAPVRKSTLAVLFGLLCLLAVGAGVLRGVFINIFGY